MDCIASWGGKWRTQRGSYSSRALASYSHILLTSSGSLRDSLHYVLVFKAASSLYTQVLLHKSSKSIPKKKKCKKAKWLSEKKREVKGKGEGKIHATECRVPENSKERCFLSEQCKETEENNRMGKTRDLFKKNWRYQENTSCKDGHDKRQIK